MARQDWRKTYRKRIFISHNQQKAGPHFGPAFIATQNQGRRKPLIADAFEKAVPKKIHWARIPGPKCGPAFCGHNPHIKTGGDNPRTGVSLGREKCYEGPMIQTSEQIQTRMRELTDFISQSAQSVREGRMVTLHHLDDEVAALCDAALALPPAEAKQIQPSMAGMIAQLEDLARALEQYRAQKGGT